MPTDWTSIHMPRGLRGLGTVLLELGLGLFLVALLTVGAFTLRGAAGSGIILALLLAGVGAVLFILGTIAHRVAPADAAATKVDQLRRPISIFGERVRREDGAPLSKAEDDAFRSIVGGWPQNDDPREGSNTR